MLPAVLVLAALFVLLLGARVGGAQRYVLLARWPALVFAAAAIVALFRGAVTPALALATLAVIAWMFWPAIARGRAKTSTQTPRPDLADAEARAILGVSATATESEIRSAYRERMRRAHPDQGGAHADAARLTAARDRLLKKR